MGGKARQPSAPRLGGGLGGGMAQAQPSWGAPTGRLSGGMGAMPSRSQAMGSALMGGGTPSMSMYQNAGAAQAPQQTSPNWNSAFGPQPASMGGAVSSGPQGNFNAMMGGAMPGIQASPDQMNSMQGAAQPPMRVATPIPPAMGRFGQNPMR